MDDEKLEQLLAGMSDAMGAALGQALQTTFGEEAMRQKREAQAEEERMRDLAMEQREQIEWAMERARQNQRHRASALLTDVRCYSQEMYHDTLKELKADERMPGCINYAERYAAFKRMQKSDELLKRIDQTIAAAERAIERASCIRPEAAVREKANQYKQRMELLGTVAVGAASRNDEDDEANRLRDEHDRMLTKEGDQAAVPLEEAMLTAYLGVLGSAALEPARAAGEPTTEEENDILIEEAVEAAERAAEKIVARNAAHAEGTRIIELPLRDFSGTVGVEQRYDVNELKQLTEQVRASFQTYEQCVRDNGLFSAFPDGSKYGEGVPWAYIYPVWREIDQSESSSKSCDIPDVVDDQAEDDPARAIARMKEFNAKKYWGMLDDDFSEHVDAFWYGFKKLMEFVNGLFDVDLSGYSSYVEDVQRKVETAANLVGLNIDDAQLKGLSDQVADIKDKLEAGVE